MKLAVSLLLFAIAIWQFYATYQAFHTLKTKGNASTSSFAMLSLWSSLVFGVLMLTFGFILLFGGFELP